MPVSYPNFPAVSDSLVDVRSVMFRGNTFGQMDSYCTFSKAERELAASLNVSETLAMARLSRKAAGLDLVYEIERRFGINAELNALRTRTNQLISESNKYCVEVARGKAATIRMGIELDEAKERINALTLALEVERDAANLYAKQAAHWIDKHDALLAQQLETVPQEWNDKNVIAWCVARGIKCAT